ncbi:MAG: ABC transporter permease [Neisseria sp.]|nr:ABC transporter permease [Neisseria sp.]
MLFAAIIKEFKLLLRDLHGLAVLFVMPIAFMLIMSVALSNDQDPHENISLGFLSAENQPVNAPLTAALAQERINVRLLPSDDGDHAAAKQALAKGEFDVLLENPNQVSGSLKDDKSLILYARADTDRARLAGIKGVLQRHYTEARLNLFFEDNEKDTKLPAGKLPRSVRQTMQKNLREEKADIFDTVSDYLAVSPIEEVFLDGHGQQMNKPSSVQHSVPAWLIFGMFFIMIPLSNVMAMERNTNTITRLRLAQTPAADLILSKLLPYFFINQCQFAGMVALGVYLLPHLGVDALTLHGAWWHYALLSAAVSLSALGYALLISVSAKSTEHAVVLGGGGIILMAAIGGIMVPSYIMPAAMQTLSQISPMAWGLSAFQSLLLNQGDLSSISQPLLLLSAFGLLCLLAATLMYRRQLTTQVRF